MLYGAPATTFDVLQRAQNNLARVVLSARRSNRRQTILRSLHWLPVKQRVTYKMATSEADLGMCGRTGPPHEDKHKFFIAANLLQHAEKSLN